MPLAALNPGPPQEISRVGAGWEVGAQEPVCLRCRLAKTLVPRASAA